MSIQILSRCAVVLLLIASVSGCSSTKTTPSASAPNVSSTQASDSCASNRRACIYKGAYESGERDYAEQEAKRLNLAEYERLRRGFSK
jgi:hypothetical protein